MGRLERILLCTIMLVGLCLLQLLIPNVVSYSSPTTGPISPTNGQYAHFISRVWRGFTVEFVSWIRINYSAQSTSNTVINVTLVYGFGENVTGIYWQLVNTTDRRILNASIGPPSNPSYYVWWIQGNLSIGQYVLFGGEYRNVTSGEVLSISIAGPYVSSTKIQTWVLGPAAPNQSATLYWFDQKSGHLLKYMQYGSKTNTEVTMEKTNIPIGAPYQPQQPENPEAPPWYTSPPFIIAAATAIGLSTLFVVKRIRRRMVSQVARFIQRRYLNPPRTTLES